MRTISFSIIAILALLFTADNATAQKATDRTLFGLKGTVASCTDQYGQKTAFSAQGRITMLNGVSVNSANMKTRRNAKGQITQIVSREEMEGGDYGNFTATYTYDPQGRVKQIKHDTPYDSWNETLSYDAKGNVTQSKNISGTESNVIVYTYISFDSKGNWTKRKYARYALENGKRTGMYDNGEEIRKITYYNTK